MKNLKKKIEKNYKLKNVKPKNLNVMKKNLLKLMMLVALVIVANTTFAAIGDKFDPFVDSDHTYTLDYTLPGAGTVKLNITSADDATLTNITIGTIAPASVTSYAGVASTSQTAGDYTLSIPITFLNTATVADVYNIDFETTVTSSNCTNNINVNITISAEPIYNIAIATATTGGCQELNATPGNNVDASVGSENSITYTVTPATAPDGVASYSYTVGITSTEFTTNCASCGSGKTGTASYAATFESVEGTGGTVTGTISGTFTMTAEYGAGTYDMTATANDVDVAYSALPTIGDGTNGGFY
jgi:hypothetical protein